MAQLLIERKKLSAYDVPRTARMAAIGLFFTVGFVLTLYQLFLLCIVGACSQGVVPDIR